MFSDSELQRIQGSIARHRTEQQKLQREGDEVRDRERKAISRIQLDAEREYSQIQRKRTDLDREIQRLEQDLKRRRAELEKQDREHQNQSHH